MSKALQVERVAEAVQRVLVLAAGNRDMVQRAQLGIAGEVVGDHRLLEPAQIERLQQPEHAPGVFEVQPM